MSKEIDRILIEEFTCPKCNNVGADVKRLAMAGTGITRFMDIQANRYAFASCLACGFTEIYSLKILESRRNDQF